jgi:hypothetical protein
MKGNGAAWMLIPLTGDGREGSPRTSYIFNSLVLSIAKLVVDLNTMKRVPLDQPYSIEKQNARQNSPPS